MDKKIAILFLIVVSLSFFVRETSARNISWPDGCISRAGYASDIRAACEKAIRAVTGWPSFEDCEYHFPDAFYNDEGAKIAFYPLGRKLYLGEVHCGLIPPPYNADNFYLLYDETQTPPKAEILKFPAYDTPGSDASEADLAEFKRNPKTVMRTRISGRRFDRQTRELIVLTKYRGLGDCGEYARYSFHDGKPRLKEFQFKSACDGKLFFPTRP